MDFTLKTYKRLLQSFMDKGYAIQPFADYLTKPAEGKVLVLRHDVDLKPQNSFAIAKIEYELGVKSSYYFRAVRESWDENIILEIARLGHEVGYHYESLTTCHGDLDEGYNDFVKNLGRLRQLVEVKTICMHGSPRSPYDSKDLWKKYSYKKLGLIGEPYFDMDFSRSFYLTDTGRCWDGFNVSVRDKIPVYQDEWVKKGLVFHTSADIVAALDRDCLPELIMMTTHPQRWTDDKLLWLKELIIQNVKNLVKRFVVKK